MKNGILVFIVFILGSGFVFDEPNDKWMVPRFDRIQPKRPYFDVPLLRISKVDITKVRLIMYDSENPDKIMLRIDQNGFFWDGKKICDWGKINNTYGISKKCSQEFPVGSYLDSGWWEKKNMWYENYRGTYIELKNIQYPNEGKKPFRLSGKEKIFLEYGGRKAFSYYGDVLKDGWEIHWGDEGFLETKKNTAQILMDKRILENLDRIESCYNKKDSECLSDYVTPGQFEKVDGLFPRDIKCDTPRKMARCLLNDDKDLSFEMRGTLGRRDFPCILSVVNSGESKKQGKQQIVLVGEEYEVRLGLYDGTWKIEQFLKIRPTGIDIKVKGESIYNYCYKLGKKYEDFYDKNILKKDIRQEVRIDNQWRDGIKSKPWEKEFIKKIEEKRKKGLLPVW